MKTISQELSNKFDYQLDKNKIKKLGSDQVSAFKLIII
jgi:hypothetical protein